MTVKFHKESSTQNYTFFYHYKFILHENVILESFCVKR